MKAVLSQGNRCSSCSLRFKVRWHSLQAKLRNLSFRAIDMPAQDRI